MASIDIVSEFVEFMDPIKEAAKDWSHMTVTVGYATAEPKIDRKSLEKVMAAIRQYFPLPLLALPDGCWVDSVRVIGEMGDGRFNYQFELPLAGCPEGEGSGEQADYGSETKLGPC